MNIFRDYYTILQKPWTVRVGLAIVFLLVLATRLYHIKSIPAVVSHDEVFYPTQAAALAISGTDTSGVWSPISLSASHPLFAELPGFVMSISFFLFPNDHLFAFKFTSALFGSMLVMILAFIGVSLSKKPLVGVGVFIVAIFNPWLFQFSRMGFDSLFSLFFYFLSILIILELKSWKKLWSLPFLFLGFYQYQGLKVVFVPFVLSVLLYVGVSGGSKRQTSVEQKRRLAPLWVLTVCTLALFGFYVVRLQLRPDQERAQRDLLFSDKARISAIVNMERQQAFEHKLSPLFINKLTVTSKLFLSQYLESFSPTQLFITGEPLRNPFSVWRWGMFHPIDVVFIAFGFFVLFSNVSQRRNGLLLLSLLLIAPLPAALNAKGTWIMFRSSFMVPVLILIAGFGLAYLLEKLPKYVRLLPLMVYGLSMLFFIFEYFAKYPVYGTQGEYFAERVVSSYVHRQTQKNIIVLASEPRFMYESILLFNNAIVKNKLSEIQKSIQTGNYTIDNIIVTNGCFASHIANDQTTTIVHAVTPNCESETVSQQDPARKSSIVSLLDSGAQYHIYNDTLCSQYPLERFSHVTKNLFEVESLTTEQFCKTFISKEQ